MQPSWTYFWELGQVEERFAMDAGIDDESNTMECLTFCDARTLRTLKSGVCCGVSAAEQERARATDPSWCTSGKFGVIQFKQGQ